MTALEDTINVYYMPPFNKNETIIEYYHDIFEGINCLVWEATNAKANLQAANWQTRRPLIGWHGSALMLPGA